MSVNTVLFDADGVLQRPDPASRQLLGTLLGPREDRLAEFLRDVWAAEAPTLTGQSDFAAALTEVLARWDCSGNLDEALRAWTMLDVDEEVVDVIRALRRTGARCFLATNQNLHRARYMSEGLGYAELFEREFYSCRVGLRKPDAEYFRAILKEIGTSPDDALFLDDSEVNVRSAREVGLRAEVFTLESGVGVLRSTLRSFGLSVAEPSS